MSLSIYQQSIVSCSASGLAWTSQGNCGSESSNAIRQNRLRRHSDGTVEVIHHTPCEVIGRRVIRPLLNTAYDLSSRTFRIFKRGFSFLDTALSRTLNFLPGAAASPTPDPSNSNLQQCLAPHLRETVGMTTKAVATGDSKMVVAAHTLYGPFFAQCFNDVSYSRVQEIDRKNKEQYAQENSRRASALKACNEANDNQCTDRGTTGNLPDMFQIEVKKRLENGLEVIGHEWTTSSGYLFWIVKVKGWIYNSHYANGSYNYDEGNGRPTVSTKDQIMQAFRRN